MLLEDSLNLKAIGLIKGKSPLKAELVTFPMAKAKSKGLKGLAHKGTESRQEVGQVLLAGPSEGHLPVSLNRRINKHISFLKDLK